MAMIMHDAIRYYTLVAVMWMLFPRCYQSVAVEASYTKKTRQYVDTYDGCGEVTGCFGIPDDCVAKKNCDILLTFVRRNQVIDFVMTGALGESNKYLAMGLSISGKMGPSSVTQCVLLNKAVEIRQSWNPEKGRKNELVKITGELQESAEYVNDVITCKWKRDIVTKVCDTTFNILTNKYYLVLAKGPTDSQGNLRYHEKQRGFSSDRVNLSSISLVRNDNSADVLISMHATLMTLSWLGLISSGIMLARYYKLSWKDRTLCNVKIWFALHRGLMVLSLFMIIIALILIFVKVGGWSQVDGNPHPILGCVAVGLALIQPFMAFFRPEPNSSRRPVFNLSHQTVGYSSYIIAAANLPDTFLWVLVGVEAVFATYHIIMLISNYIIYKKKEVEDKDFQEHDFNEKLLVLYIFFVSNLVVTMIVFIWKG
ncbi:putative ferric-chelate reductase 1 homolog isoform X2 [Tachypleus tridentatus]|uniref:putative ferric-chelate reductase 1 homolog isoform X2 n=1 Tax=Tachypleus tridentatus TaxID=6853 RepID=UPI003FD6B270